MSQYLDKDGASRIAENFLSKQTEQDAILKNLQFDLKEAEHALVKTIQGPAPLNIRALSRPLDDYLISGNTLQNGTPTPEAPVDVVGCGVRTGNLVEKRIDGCNINTSGVLRSNESWNMFVAKVEQGKTYCIDTPSHCGFYESEPFIGSASYDGQRQGIDGTFISPITGYIAFRKGSSETTAMMNEGSQLLPYEPYGYKLSLTVNGTEYPIYLGQVETTRWIRKLVLTGEEGWNAYTSIADCYRLDIRDNPGIIGNGICSHYAKVETTSQLTDGTFVSGQNYSYFKDVSAQNLDGWKSYLTAQYAAGTPVTIWYVLATQETGIVNEPLMKIGDYADTISMAQSGVEISTTKGFNAITTDTTVLPSNIEVKGVINNA